MSSQDACLGVQVTVIRGRPAIQARVTLEVCDDPLYMMMRMFRCGSMHWVRRCRKPVKAAVSLRAAGSATTCPVAMCSAAMMETVPLRTYSNSRRARRPGAGQAARGGQPSGVLAVFRLDPGFLVDADHDGAWRRAQIGAADRGGLRPELVVIGAPQFAAGPGAVQPERDAQRTGHERVG